MSYEPLWNTLKEKKISKYELINKHHVSTGTLDAFRKGNSVTLNTLHDISKLLDCNIQDIVTFTKD
ncbi:MAG: helix-turn-helix domain-containing protein [[Clostridium] innocuum]|uniref:helix-turn-helix domain-containing protein n=1 Tax=Clostridium TaxID=1485 RepID=UPI00210E3B36|nr:helix-turn-helix transcriptional regulator [[Clostridium] innocuum]MCQ5280585.1 helix-turn-helix transcriptional regulator [Clostridium sp. DFI.1.208]